MQSTKIFLDSSRDGHVPISNQSNQKEMNIINAKGILGVPGKVRVGGLTKVDKFLRK